MRKGWLACTVLVLGGVSASAGAQSFQITPIAYDMFNGERDGSTYFYNDYKYGGAFATGNTSVEKSALQFGLGLLADSQSAPGAALDETNRTYYVGWHTIDPVITFTFDKTYRVDQIQLFTVNLTDPLGSGNVSGPTSVTVDYSTDKTNWTTGVVSTPTYSGSGLATLSIGTSNIPLAQYLRVTATRKSNDWLMLSEVKFQGAAVPEPASLLAIGAGLVAFARRRRSGK